MCAVRHWSTLVAGKRFGAARRRADGDVVFAKGDPLDHVYALVAGAVEILQPALAATDATVVVKLLAAPTLFGAIEALGDEPRALESVRALGDTDVVAIERAAFRATIAADLAAAHECLLDVGRAFCVAAKFEPSRLADVDARLAAMLLAYVDVCGEPWDGGVRMRVKRTQADLAGAIGASERTVNRVLADWKARGFVDKNDARYIVHDAPALHALAGELAGALVHRSSA